MVYFNNSNGFMWSISKSTAGTFFNILSAIVVTVFNVSLSLASYFLSYKAVDLVEENTPSVI